MRAYALRRGVSAEAVSKAVASGRLDRSVTRIDGRPKIADPELADREWAANTRSNGNRPEPAAPVPAPAQAPAHSGGIPDLNTSRALRAAAAARREAAMADLAELELAERRGQLVPANEARARVAQRRPHLAAEVTQADLDMLAALAVARSCRSQAARRGAGDNPGAHRPGALAVALLAELEPHQLATASPAIERSVVA